MQSKSKIIFLYIIFFFSTIGYYTALTLFTNIFGPTFTRNITIPMRLLVLVSLFFYSSKIYNLNLRIKSNQFFFLFSVIYSIRLVAESFKDEEYYMSLSNFAFYFFGFCILPYIGLSNLKLDSDTWQKIKLPFLFGIITLSTLCLVYYGNLIGQVTRISEGISKDANYISPLALSYCSVLGSLIFLSSFFLERRYFRKILLMILLIFSLIPMILGGSRGGYVAYIFVSLFFVLLRRIKIFNKSLIILILIVVVTAPLIYGYFESSFNRVVNINEDIVQENTSAYRIVLYKEALEQISLSPIFGSSLQIDNVQIHPHNLFLDILLSTGIIGLLFFLIWLRDIFKNTIYIIRNSANFYWIPFLFLVGFISSQFSGSMVSSLWLFSGAGMINGFVKSFKKNADFN